MAGHASQFIITPRGDIDDIKARLMRTFPLSDDGIETRRRQFYDTFDWRLYRKGLTLEEERHEHGRRIVVRDLASGAIQRWIDNIEMPRFVHDLPRGPFRERLLAIADVRALLPLIEVHTDTHNLRLRDREDKTVARVEIELADNRAHLQRLGKRLRIQAIRGYPGPATRLTRYATKHLKLATASTPLLDDALASCARQALDYTNRIDVDLDPNEPAQDAVCRILLRLLQTIEENVPGTREHIDTEFLHDLRVAVRRTRSMIGQLKRVFDPAEIAPFRSEFKWLGSITSRCRDLDVYLLAFDEYQLALPCEHRPALEPVQRFLQRLHAEEQRRLSQWLDSTRFRSLIVNWREFLTHPGKRKAPDARRKLRRVADERIWQAYQRVRDRGRQIRGKTPIAKLHELRIHGKKLRYLMEFFREVYPRKKTRIYIGALKRLQENLGDLHDYYVQSNSLRDFAEQMQQQELATPQTLAAIDELARGLDRRERQARKAFAGVFADFDKPRNRTIARALFRPGKKRR